MFDVRPILGYRCHMATRPNERERDMAADCGVCGGVAKHDANCPLMAHNVGKRGPSDGPSRFTDWDDVGFPYNAESPDGTPDTWPHSAHGEIHVLGCVDCEREHAVDRAYVVFAALEYVADQHADYATPDQAVTFSEWYADTYPAGDKSLPDAYAHWRTQCA